MFLMMSGFVFEGAGQVNCDDIKVRIGDAISTTNCFTQQVPVWFEYDNPSPNPPSSFTVCSNPGIGGYNIIIEGDVALGYIESIIINPNLPNQAFTTGTWVVLDHHEHFLVESFFDVDGTITMGFGSEANPHFYLEILADPDEDPVVEDFRITLSMPFSFRLDDECDTGGTCTPELPVVALYDGVAEETTPCVGLNAFSTHDLDFEFFFDVDNIVYEPGNTRAKLPLKLKTNSADFVGENFELERLGFSFSWTDVYDNLDVWVPLQDDDQYFETEVLEAMFLNTTHSNEATVDMKATGGGLFSIPFDAAGEALLFYIIIDTPIEALAGGEADFIFGYQRSVIGDVYLPAPPSPGICCIFAPAQDTNVPFDTYNFPCADTNVKLDIGAASETDCSSVRIPVYLKDFSTIPSNRNVTDILVEIELALSGGLLIDEIATGNSLNIFTASLGITTNTVKLTLIDADMTVDFISTNPLLLFEIVLMGNTVGAIEDIYVKHADFKFTDETNACVTPLSGSPNPMVTNYNFGCDGQYGDVFLIDDLDAPPPTDQAIDNVYICLRSAYGTGVLACATNGSNFNTHTDTDGDFGLSTCEPGHTYTVGASKADDVLGQGNGSSPALTTFDIVIITKHILGIQKFDIATEKWKYLAADLNNSNTITTFDAIKLKKLILGIDVAFPTGVLPWMMVPVDAPWQDFVINNGSWDDDSMLSPCIENLHGVNCNIDFYAIKLGDVNRSYTQSLDDKPVDKLLIEVREVPVPNGVIGSYEIEFVPLGFSNIVALQMAIRPTATKLTYDNWSVKDLPYTDSNSFHAADGTIRYVWYDETTAGKHMQADDKIFGLAFQTILPTGYSVEDIVLDNTVLPARAWDALGREYEIELVYTRGGGPKSLKPSNTKEVTSTLWVYDKKGNPYIEVNASSNQTTVLNVYDIQGKKIHQQKVILTKGLNTINPIIGNNLPAGLYVFHLQMETQALVGKWIKQ